jgi:DNA-directed RNA polymerase specialized sigma24 family protein
MMQTTLQKAATTQRPPSPLELALRDPKFYKGLLDWTFARIGHMEDAEDVLGLAVVRALRREASGDGWVPDGKTTAGLHMIRFLKGALSDRKKTAWHRRGSPVEDIDVFASEDTSPGERATRKIQGEEIRKRGNELHRELSATGRDPLAVGILEAWAVGVTEHAEIAERVGGTIADVRAGLKRLARYAQASIDSHRQRARFQ